MLKAKLAEIDDRERKVAEKEKALLMKVRARSPGLAISVSSHPSSPLTLSPLSHSLLLT